MCEQRRVRFVTLLLSFLLVATIGLATFPASPAAQAASFPTLKFPWPAGACKNWTVGLHGAYYPDRYCDEVPSTQTYALDFGGSFTVVAAGPGTVEKTGYLYSGCPKGIRIKHNATWATDYCHLSEVWVNKGARVGFGTKIGKSGNSGCPGCGVHLHFSLLKWTNNAWVLTTWDNKILDGWLIRGVRSSKTTDKFLYGQATATKVSVGSYCPLPYLTRAYNPPGTYGCPGKWVYAWLTKEAKYTRDSYITLQAYGQTYSNPSLCSTNR